MSEGLIFLLLLFVTAFHTSESLSGGNGTIKRYPFMTSVRKLDVDQYLHICGGSLLSLNWVLTAKQCVVDDVNHHLYTVDNFRVYAGSDVIESENLKADELKHVQRRAVKKVAALSPLDQIHYNDVAMMKVDHPFDESDYVRPSNVPWIKGVVTTGEDIADLFENCVMVGFGCEMDERDEDDDDYDDDDDDDEDEHRRENDAEHRARFKFAEDSDGFLKAANVSLIPRAVYGRILVAEPMPRDRVLIAEIPESEVTACDGDFGGPLVCGDDEAQYGVISRGDPEKFVVFTRVDAVSGWIAMLMQEDQDLTRSTKPAKKTVKKAFRSNNTTSSLKMQRNSFLVIFVVISMVFVN